MADCNLNISYFEPIVNNINTGSGYVVNGINTNVVTCKNINVRDNTDVSGILNITNTTDNIPGVPSSGALVVNGDLTVSGNVTISDNVTVNGVAKYYDLTKTTVYTKNVTKQFGPDGSVAPIDKYRGGALAPNGKIYCIPGSATSILVIDTNNIVSGVPTTYTIGSFPGGVQQWNGGVLAPNGKIYCPPLGDTGNRILVIDTKTDSISYIVVTSNGRNTGILAPNGKIYFTKSDTNTGILVVDTSNDTFTTIDSSPALPVGSGWYGGVLAPNGLIYCCPFNGSGATSVLIINPANNTLDIETIKGLPPTVPPQDGRYFGGSLAPNGKIYFMSFDAPNVLIVDPNSPVTSVTGTVNSAFYTDSSKKLTMTGGSFTTQLSVGDNIIITTATARYIGYVETIVFDWELKFFSALGSDIGVGTITNVQKTRRADFTSISGIPQNVRICGSVLAQNGLIYGASYQLDKIPIIDPDSPVTNLTGTAATATYDDNTQILTLPGSSFSTELTVGDNIIITTALPTRQQFMGYVGSINSGLNQATFMYKINSSFGSGSIFSVQKTRKLDLTLNHPEIGLGDPNAVKHAGAVLGPNNKVYFMPFRYQVLELSVGLPKLADSWILSGYYNKW